jgi:phage gp29-like protein
MGLFSRIKQAFSEPKARRRSAVIDSRPLYEQFTRIGGSLTPEQVTNILREADCGRPASLVDLFQEARQKDGELQSTCAIRDQAVSLCEVKFLVDDTASRKERKAVELLQDVVGEFDNWPTLIDSLTASYIFGHATDETPWKVRGGYVVPYKAKPVNLRDFVFRQRDGELRYSPDHLSWSEGVDLLADNPGRIVQIQRRIVGDIQMREGLARLLCWGALFRNWSLTDWIDVGQLGWRPWRIGTYKKGAGPEDIEGLETVLREIGRSGAGVIPDTTEIAIEWPKGQAVGGQGKSQHGELFETVGKEMRKAILGVTSSTDSTVNGDRAATATRDKIRQDIHRRDAIEVAACLRYQLFRYVVEANLGPNVRTPIAWFDTDGSGDRLEFAQAMKAMKEAGVRIPQQWAREEFGAPDPKDDEETNMDDATQEPQVTQ